MVVACAGETTDLGGKIGVGADGGGEGCFVGRAGAGANVGGRGSGGGGGVEGFSTAKDVAESSVEVSTAFVVSELCAGLEEEARALLDSEDG